ncbi:hypothetical protein [Halorientalis brevis]|uniref:hypothetical protein n=1 Tax=Halorientalis brevis TaxID=1126241 RepID=UPI001FFAB418|nr:hypothetical protein [Halorientalis brevis]
MTDAIESAGAYTPRFRIDADAFVEAWDSFDAPGVERKAVPAADEDAVTMAVEAATDALAGSDHDRDEVIGLAFASTTPPVDEGDVAATVAEILGLDHGVETAAFTQSTGAGGRALRWGTSVPAGPTLVVAADAPRGEPDDAVDHAAGAGAVAFLLAEDGPVEIVETATYTEEFPGTRFRERGEAAVNTYDATAYEREAYGTVVAGAVEALDEAPTAVAPTAPDGKRPYRIARRLDGDVDVYQTASDLGDTGAASPFFGLLAAWADDRDEVTLVAYGDGASAVAGRVTGTLDATWDRETADVSYAEYARKRGHVVATGGDD